MKGKLKILHPYVYIDETNLKKEVIHFCPITKRPYMTKSAMARLFCGKYKAVSTRINHYCHYHGFVPGSLKAHTYEFTDEAFTFSNGCAFNSMIKPIYPTHLMTNVFDYFNSNYYGLIKHASIIRSIVSYGCDNIYFMPERVYNFMEPFEHFVSVFKEYKPTFADFIKTD